ncbi:MAG TPA: glycosyltransferase family 39 protein [Kiritimatiellia bacterium]|jgi:4-amino-4-deoxy-L-arabinose transferase|nr:glycosyltransferase family 39 protein [Kiritimatiellia bacterium]OQC59962.1 MAG: Undecaprenyl phosphate-alpha-4-amino-4-deoxy-L-arabinose arabinosyl transferase [Verrucomicrobia bacterium ADurb.Bin018]MBP9572387.1 glycosyltransferase family 39 protein [Kiritimatiellia bacterium]HOD99643.1 glycosyltransferase family 39 protein [Kiritimatiellia bacterium]HOE36396.1 glycosyltransferase family 39 protein [Kiritimatiellia bacterium]
MASPANAVAPPAAARAFDFRSLWLVLLFAFIGAASFQGSRGLYESTEGRYAETARETMLSGDYDDPILNLQPHWTKPPLTYVAIIYGLRLFGENPWGVRAYLVFALVLAAGAVWLAGSSIWGSGAGRWAGIIFATSPFIALAAHSVTTDMLVALWTAGALAAFWHGYASHCRLSLLGMWLFLALGLLTKGPPALLVPAVCLPVAWIHLRRANDWRPGRWNLGLGLSIFILLGLGWYFVEARLNPGLTSYWLGKEMIARNFTSEMHRNPNAWFVFFVYLPILVAGTGPWLPLALFRARPLKAWLAASDQRRTWNRAARRSLLAGVAVPFVLFSISQSRLALYLVPLFVPLCLLLGRMIDVLIAQGRLRARVAGGCAGVLLAGIVIAKSATLFITSSQDMTRLSAILAPVLARHEEHALCSISNQRLNGLEFHLRRPIEAVDPDAIWDHMKATALGGRPTDYLVKNARWARLATNAPARVHAEPVGPHWLLVAPEPAAWREKFKTP